MNLRICIPVGPVNGVAIRIHAIVCTYICVCAYHIRTYTDVYIVCNIHTFSITYLLCIVCTQSVYTTVNPTTPVTPSTQLMDVTLGWFTKGLDCSSFTLT